MKPLKAIFTQMDVTTLTLSANIMNILPFFHTLPDLNPTPIALLQGLSP